MYDDTQQVVVHGMGNGANGHCWIHVAAQAYAVDGGWPVDLVERAFSQKGSDRLYNLSAAARRLTVAVLDVSEDPLISGVIGAMTGPQVGTDPEAIRGLALDYRKSINHPADLRNTLLYMDPILGGGGHGGPEAICALAEGLGIDLLMGRDVDVWEEYVNGSTTKRMALHDADGGHWSLQVFMTYKEGDGAHRVGNESDVLDYVEARIDLSLAEVATHTVDDPTSTGDDGAFTGDDVKPPGIDTGSDTEFSDSTTAPPSPISSRGDATPDCTTGTGDDAELRETAETTDPHSPTATPDPIPESTVSSSPRVAPSSSWDGATPDPVSEPSSPTSSRASRGSHPWEDDEYWDDDQNYLNHNSFFTEEEGEEVCLFPSVWEGWTRGPEEVCLFPSVWSEWTRTQPRKHGRVRGSGGRRTTMRRNKKRRCPRRRQERRRRRALRRKQLARRARVGGRRRRLPTCFRGGGDSGDEGDQGTGGETAQAAAHVVVQETGQAPVVSGAHADPEPPIPGGLGKRARKAPYRGFRPAHLASTLLHKHPEINGEVRETSVGFILVNAGSGGKGPAGGGKRKADSDGGGRAKRKAGRCLAGGGCLGGGGSSAGGGGSASASGGGGGGSGDRDGDGDGNDDGAAPMEVSDDDMSRAALGGGGGDSDSEWSAGGDDGDDGGGDTDGDGDISSHGSGGSGSGSDGSGGNGGGTDSGSDNSGSDGSGGRGRVGGGRGRGGGGRAPKRLNGTARVSGPDLMGIFTTLSSDPRYEASDKAHIATYRERSETNLKKREGTAPSAKRTKYGIGSMPKLEVVLRGLTEDSKGLPLKNDVFFDRKQLSDLKDDFNIAYMLDPNHIGVALGKTKVKTGGRSLVVKSFDHGEYTLEDDETKIRQWELLECKCGGGVTLDDALRRFILHLVSTQTIMKIHGAPFVRGDKYPEMLWNIRDAIARLEEEEDVELEDGEMDLPELEELKECLDGRRTLMLKVFTSCSVEDTLPANFWPSEKDGDLHKFARTDGSLAALNLARGLRWDTTNDDMATGILFSGDVVRGGHSEAPRDDEPFGNWEAKLKNMILLLTFAYRLGRTTNFLEAYAPLTQQEADAVKRHHSQCGANLRRGAGDLFVAETWKMEATPEQLAGEKAYALRFVRARSAVVLPTYLPVMVLAHGIRDSLKLRALAADSVDTGAFSLARAGAHLLRDMLTVDRCGEPVEAMFDKAEKVCNQTRKLRETRVAKTSGSMGDSSNMRKSRVGMVEATAEEREQMIEIYTRLVFTNGIQSVMDAIGEVDPSFVEWGIERLAAAKEVSTSFERDEIKNDDHLFGTYPKEVAEGRRRVTGLVEKLEAKGITCRDFAVFSVATMLTIDVSGATIRTKDFFALLLKTMWYDKKAGVLKLGMPIKAKQSESADRKLEMACKEHDIHGHGIVRWCMVMTFAGREMLKKHNNGELSRFFGPLQANGKQLSRSVFGDVFRECARSFFGEANMSIASMRSVQDTLAVEYGRELCLAKDHPAFVSLAKQQRTSTKKLFTSYLAAARDDANGTVYEGFVSFAGGIRKMIEDRRVREDNKKAMGTSSTPSDASVSGAGTGSDRVPFYGGPAYPIDAEEAAFARDVRMLELKARKQAAVHVLARRAPGFGDSGGDPEGVTTAGATTTPAAIGEAVRAGKRDKKGTTDAGHGNGRGPGGEKMEYNAGRPKDETCSGMRALVEAIGQAYERAKAEGGNKNVLARMNHRKNGTAKLPLVKWLVANDDDFKPGAWYTESKFQAATNMKAFERLLNKVEAHTDVRWLSWLSSEGSIDAAPVA